ncbi:MAG: DUF2288 domain-containing protein [Gammaproteobacteria bacterium]|nr:DUF2288 domain-containing protein [Gammaproteobacteria bacterium]MDP6617780.1 DUF2288 domain-containing protein [Gammaproteobacteria bacterium]MDP6694166.1 DUF2288 domain-containing protein [Gammaproteobacteria bacterium]
MSGDKTAERARINGETAKIAWQELQRFFARGNAVAVSHRLDLVEVAYQMSADNKEQIEEWMEAGQLVHISDAQASEWYDANALVWAVVVRPWVLVQPVLNNQEQ